MALPFLRLHPACQWRCACSSHTICPFPPAGTRKLQLSVEFRGLGLRLRSCGKSVLQSVSGALQACTLTAIMGPSGEHAVVGPLHKEKTRLMHTLSQLPCGCHI